MVCLLNVVGSERVPDDSYPQRGPTLLRQAIKYLVNYTASEAEERLDMISIGSTVAAIAYEELTEKLANKYPRHCNDFQNLNKPVTSGITLIKPDDDEPFRVYCSMEHQGGGWTRIQRRSTQKISFRRDWNAYREGFGYLSQDVWLGLEKIHRLTNHYIPELLITLTDKSYNVYFAQYKEFSVGSEDTEYRLYIGNYTGDAGDSLSYSNYAKFSTYDKDNDGVSYTNCASSNHGGWWYKGSSCFQGKLNGDPYSSSTSGYYVKWPAISSYAMYTVTMEIRLSD